VKRRAKGALTIRIIARDPGGGYSEAAAKALPDAMQVADRWRLMENASQALCRSQASDVAGSRSGSSHSPSTFQIANDGSVAMIAPPGKIIDADDHEHLDQLATQREVSHPPPIPALNTPRERTTAGASTSARGGVNSYRHAFTLNGGTLDDIPRRNLAGRPKSLIYGMDSLKKQPTASPICSKPESESRLNAD
jgi:hypothetical protein